MTICAGFICTDGLLLTADTEITGAAKYDATKIRKVKFPGGVFILTGAGNASYIGMASDMIAAKLRDGDTDFTGSLEQRKDLFFNLVREEVFTIHQNYVWPSNGVLSLALILGVQFDGEWDTPFLMHCASDGGVYWANDDVVEGSGEDIARSFRNIMCRERLPLDMMRSVAIFCLYQAKQGAVGCGGSTHSFIFPAPGSNTVWDESVLVEEAEEALRFSLVESRNRSASLEKFKERANEFVQKLIAVREDVERIAVSHQFILEVLRKRASSPSVPEPPTEQSGAAAQASGS